MKGWIVTLCQSPSSPLSMMSHTPPWENRPARALQTNIYSGRGQVHPLKLSCSLHVCKFTPRRRADDWWKEKKDSPLVETRHHMTSCQWNMWNGTELIVGPGSSVLNSYGRFYYHKRKYFYACLESMMVKSLGYTFYITSQTSNISHCSLLYNQQEDNSSSL